MGGLPHRPFGCRRRHGRTRDEHCSSGHAQFLPVNSKLFRVAPERQSGHPPSGRHGGESAITLDDHFKQIAELVALVIQAGAVLVVTFGAAQALTLVAAAIWQGEAVAPRGREIWLRFATWILLALEFALAADLVRTAVAPTWDDIGKLAVIATIRTMLNYFLAKDIAAFEQRQQAGLETGAS